MILLLFSTLLVASTIAYQSNGTYNYYILHHDPTYATLRDVADLLGVQIVEPIGELEDFWLARSHPVSEISNDDTTDVRAGIQRTDQDDPVIEAYRRMRHRTLLSRRGEDFSLALKHLSREESRQVTQNAAIPSQRVGADAPARVKRVPVAVQDPFFSKQWSLAPAEDNPDTTLNVMPVWESGFTGKGIVTAIIDTGVLFIHKDLEDNYASEFSWDFVNDGRPPLPSGNDTHGTACAGIIAAANNDICGVGIAYDSRVASLRLLDPDHNLASSAREARAFTYKSDDIHIYSCSYNSLDDAKHMDGQGYIGNEALLHGASHGRDSKGSIYVFAAGNGGDIGDECGYDGLASSIYTITIGALDRNGLYAGYSEPCTAVMAVTFGGYVPEDDTTEPGSIFSVGVDTDQSCNEEFAGTSAAAPAAAAIFALALEARPELTWRDIQYLCVKTARVIEDEIFWSPTASGGQYSKYLGFGLLDAHAFVKAARTWQLVESQVWIGPHYVQLDDGAMDEDGKGSGGAPLSTAGVKREVEITKEMVEEAGFDTIEHIQVRVWITHEKRGDVHVVLYSPNKDGSGSFVSTLASGRDLDESTAGFQGWTFSTLRHWGENPVGPWQVRVSDKFTSDSSTAKKGAFLGFSITLWGCAKKASSKHKLYEMPRDDHNVFPPPDLAKKDARSVSIAPLH